MGVLSRLLEPLRVRRPQGRPCGCNGPPRDSDSVEVGHVYDIERRDHGGIVEVKTGGRLLYRCLKCGDLYLGDFLPGLVSSDYQDHGVQVGDVWTRRVTGDYVGDVRLPDDESLQVWRDEEGEGAGFPVRRLPKIREVETVHGELSAEVEA